MASSNDNDGEPNSSLAPAGEAGDDTANGGSAPLDPTSSTDVVDAALRLVTTVAQATVTNALGVSVTLERHGQAMTVAASNDEVAEVDQYQYRTGQGPCLAAKAENTWFYIESLEDETRWPEFVPLALERGIHSVLSSPLLTADAPQGSLNIYSHVQHAFGTNEQELAALLAAQASDILTTAARDGSSEDQARRRSDALRVRRTIAQAEGVIVAREHLSPAAAAARLRASARTEQRTVAELAAIIVEAASVGKPSP